MKTKRTVNHGSTKKNKRTMSGGKGIISTYTRRFKDRYKKFIGISENDVTKKIKKMEAWGGLIGIYKFLEVDKIKYTNAASQKVSALEKMEENIRNTTNSSNRDGYLDAIECLQKGGDNISLLNKRCVSYDVFVNGGEADDEVGDAASVDTTNEGNTGTAAAPVVANDDDDDAAADEAQRRREADAETPRGPYDPTPDDNAEAPAVATEDADTLDAAAAAPVVADDASAAPVVADDASAAQVVADDAEAQGDVPGNTGTGTLSTSGSDEPHDGGSKRRPKSSRRVKFSKSKKGHTTHRLMRKRRK